MKHFILTSIILTTLVINCFGDDSFDRTKNYQGNNGYAYLGEILIVNYLPDLPEGFSKWDAIDNPKVVCGYRRFMSYETFDPDFIGGNSMVFTYHNEPHWLHNYAGTRACWLRGKAFKVVDVIKTEHIEYEWIFELENIEDPEDRCYYVYYGFYTTKRNNKLTYDITYLYEDFNNFPLTVLKHYEWKVENGLVK